MKINNANKIIFRSSGTGYLMVDPKYSNQLISDTTKTNLLDIFVSAVYGRREEISSKFLEKGNIGEEDAITLLSVVTKKLFKKNEHRLTNDFITGEPDLFLGESIENANETYDTKCSFSLHTFVRAKFAALNKNYYWQGQSYMWLTGAKRHTVCYCLINGLAMQIMDEKRFLSYKFGMMDREGNETEEFKKQCRQIEINHIFDIELFKKHHPGFDFHNDVTKWEWDIPAKDRVHMITFERDEKAISSLITKIRVCRNWMNRELFKI